MKIDSKNKTVYLKCFDTKNNKIFFVTSNMNDVNYLSLVDILIDINCKIKETTKEEIENQNPFLQNHYDMFFFNDENFVSMDVKPYLELSLANIKNKLFSV
jgi:hypothetical protein